MASRKLLLLIFAVSCSCSVWAEKIIWQNDFEKTDGITGLTFGPPTKGISCYGTIVNRKYAKGDFDIAFKGLDKKEKFSGEKSLKIVINSTKSRYFYFKSPYFRKKFLIEPNMYFSGFLNRNMKDAPKVVVKVCPVFETIRLKDKKRITFEYRIGGFHPTAGLKAQKKKNWYSFKMEMEPVIKGICKKKGLSLKDTYCIGWSIMINGNLKGQPLTFYIDDVKLYEKDTLSNAIKDCFYSHMWKELWTKVAPCFTVKSGKLIASDGEKKLKGAILEKHLLKNYVATWNMTRLKDNGGSERVLIIAYWPNVRVWLTPSAFPVGRQCKMRLIANNGKIRVFQKFVDNKSSKEKMVYEKDGIRAVGQFGFFHYNKFDYSYDNLAIVPLDNTVPPVPGDVNISAKQDGTASLEWETADIYKNIFKYDIYRADNPEMKNCKKIGTTGEYQFLDKNPPAEKVQYYQIVSVNPQNGKTSRSAIVKTQVGTAGAPSAVGELTACPRLENGVSIFWQKPTGNCKKIKIYKKSDNTNKLLMEVSAEKDFVIDKEGRDGNEYGVSVVNSAGKEGKIIWTKTAKPEPLKYAGEKIIKILGAPSEKDWQPPQIKKVNPDVSTLRQHPRVLFTQDEIDAAKKKITTSSWAKKCLNEIIKVADKNLSQKEIKKVDPRALAMAYVLTGQEKYAKKAKEFLIYCADNYRKLPLKNNEGRLTTYQFGDSNFISRKLVPAYDLIYNCKILSSADKRHIENDLLRPSAEDQMIDYRGKDAPFHQDHNFQAMRIEAVGKIGFCINEPKYINWAINGKHGFFSMLARCLNDDGLWWEKTVSYHVTTAIPPLLKIAQVAYNNNLDLWHTPVPDTRLYLRDWLYPVDGDNGPKTLQGALDSLLYMMFPDQSAPAFGDAVHMKWYGEEFYYLAEKHYPTARYKWFNNRKIHRSSYLNDWQRLIYWDGKYYDGAPFRIGTGKFANNGVALNGSTLFPSTGYAVLRTNENNIDAIALAFTYGPLGGGHNHGDKLSFILYSNGTVPVYKMNYGQGPYEYQRATVSTNTVVADEVSQWEQDSVSTPNTGILEFFHADKFIQTVGAYCDRAYQGIRLRRTMILCSDYLVDIFICRSPNEHQYDYVLHIDSLWDKKGAKSKGQLGAGNGYQYIDMIDKKISGGYKKTWQFPVEKPENRLVFNMLDTGKKTQFIECLAPAMNKNKKRAALIARRKAKNTAFVSVMEIPRKTSYIQNIELLQIRQDQQKAYVIGFKITHSKGVDFIFYSEDDSKYKYKNFSFKGRVFWTRYVNDKLVKKSFVKAEEFSDSKYSLNK